MINNETQKIAAERQKSPRHLREYLVYLIRVKTGQSLSQCSRTHHLARSAFAMALQGPWPNVERKIADIVGVEPWQIWPDRYDNDQQPINGSLATRRRRPAA